MNYHEYRFKINSFVRFKHIRRFLWMNNDRHSNPVQFFFSLALDYTKPNEMSPTQKRKWWFDGVFFYFVLWLFCFFQIIKHFGWSLSSQRRVVKCHQKQIHPLNIIIVIFYIIMIVVVIVTNNPAPCERERKNVYLNNIHNGLILPCCHWMSLLCYCIRFQYRLISFITIHVCIWCRNRV